MSNNRPLHFYVGRVQIVLHVTVSSYYDWSRSRDVGREVSDMGGGAVKCLSC